MILKNPILEKDKTKTILLRLLKNLINVSMDLFDFDFEI